MFYLMSVVVATVGASYAAVPLYRMFCQVTLDGVDYCRGFHFWRLFQVSGYGGTIAEDRDSTKVAEMKVNPDRLVKVSM